MAERERRPTHGCAAAAGAAAKSCGSNAPDARKSPFARKSSAISTSAPSADPSFRLTVEQRLVDHDRSRHLARAVRRTSRPAIRWSSSTPSPTRSASQQARAPAGRNDAVVTGVGKIEGHRARRSRVMDFNFMGGSMGMVVGEKLARLFDHAAEHGGSASWCSRSSGGARMQEGVLSLMQMAKVAGAIGRLRDARICRISRCCAIRPPAAWRRRSRCWAISISPSPAR